jgi:hypothetical protein
MAVGLVWRNPNVSTSQEIDMFKSYSPDLYHIVHCVHLLAYTHVLQGKRRKHSLRSNAPPCEEKTTKDN